MSNNEVWSNDVKGTANKWYILDWIKIIILSPRPFSLSPHCKTYFSLASNCILLPTNCFGLDSVSTEREKLIQATKTRQQNINFFVEIVKWSK